jgi:hypothetical protein
MELERKRKISMRKKEMTRNLNKIRGITPQTLSKEKTSKERREISSRKRKMMSKLKKMKSRKTRML